MSRVAYPALVALLDRPVRTTGGGSGNARHSSPCAAQKTSSVRQSLSVFDDDSSIGCHRRDYRSGWRTGSMAHGPGPPVCVPARNSFHGRFGWGCRRVREAAPGEAAQSIKWRSTVAAYGLLPALLQPASGATNEEWPHGNHEQWDGHEEVGKHSREPINEAEPRDAVARQADNAYQSGEHPTHSRKSNGALEASCSSPARSLRPWASSSG